MKKQKTTLEITLWIVFGLAGLATLFGVVVAWNFFTSTFSWENYITWMIAGISAMALSLTGLFIYKQFILQYKFNALQCNPVIKLLFIEFQKHIESFGLLKCDPTKMVKLNSSIPRVALTSNEYLRLHFYFNFINKEARPGFGVYGIFVFLYDTARGTYRCYSPKNVGGHIPFSITKKISTPNQLYGHMHFPQQFDEIPSALTLPLKRTTNESAQDLLKNFYETPPNGLTMVKDENLCRDFYSTLFVFYVSYDSIAQFNIKYGLPLLFRETFYFDYGHRNFQPLPLPPDELTGFFENLDSASLELLQKK